MAAPSIPFVSLEEYLEFERDAECRHEYYRGQILAMAGGTFNHGQLTGNVSRALGNALQDRPCRTVVADVRLAADPASHYTYPDVMVVCGPVEFAGARRDTITNPQLVVEVLSPSTERADRGRKFADYRRMPSLREYMMVSQSEPRVELFRRGADGIWSLVSDVAGLAARIRLESVDCEITLADVYLKIEFEPELG